MTKIEYYREWSTMIRLLSHRIQSGSRSWLEAMSSERCERDPREPGTGTCMPAAAAHQNQISQPPINKSYKILIFLLADIVHWDIGLNSVWEC